MKVIIYTGERNENGRIRKTLAMYERNQLKFADLDVRDGWHVAGVGCGKKLMAIQDENKDDKIIYVIYDGKFLPDIYPKFPDVNPRFDVNLDVLKDSERIGEEPLGELRRGIESVLNS